MMQYQEAYNRLEQYGQTHLLRYYDTLSAAEQEALLQQISEMDFSVLERAAHEEAPKGKIEPLGACTISEIAEKQDTYRKIGLEAIRKGSVGAVLLAGGQGSRLGCNGPKGVFRIGINNDLTIFECLFRNLMDVTEQAESGSFDLDVYDNGTLTVRVIDRQDGYHDGTAKIMCFDRTAPTVTAGISGEPLHIEAKDDLSGVAGIQVNGLLFTTLDGGKLDIHFNEVETLKSYEKLVVRAYDCAGNFSEAVTLKNPYYGQATSKPTTVPTATPRPAAKPTQKPGNSSSGSGNGTSGGSQATSQPTALPTFVPTVMPTLVPTLMPTFVPTAEPTAQPTAMPEYIQTGPGQAFTGSGNMRTLDVLYSAHTNKQFISLETKSGQTYYLVIDYDKPIDEEADIYETYFLNLVDDRDLLALLSEDEKPTAAPTPTPTKEPVQTDETEPKQNGTVVAGALMLAILGGGAFWYLKQRKKKESKPQPSYDEYEDDEDDETRDDDLNE